MMNTSEPRTDSPKRQWISPLANSERLASPSLTSRLLAISSARGRLERPLKSWRRFLVTSSIPVLPSTTVVFAADRSVERPRPGTRRDVTARGQAGVRTNDCAGPDLGQLTDGALHGRPLADDAVGEANLGPDADAGPDDG